MQTLIEDKDEIEKLRGLQIGTVLSLTGAVVSDERAPGGAELHDVTVKVLEPVTDEPPIEIDKPISHKAENLDSLFEYRVLNIRNLQEQKIFKIRNTITKLPPTFYEFPPRHALRIWLVGLIVLVS